MAGIAFENNGILVCKGADLRWQVIVTLPETGRGVMTQSGLHLPEAYSLNASAAKSSSFPEVMSALRR